MNQKRQAPLVRIKPDVAEQVAMLCEQTRRPISEIVSEALRFALKYAKLVPTQCYDVQFSLDTEDADHARTDSQ